MIETQIVFNTDCGEIIVHRWEIIAPQWVNIKCLRDIAFQVKDDSQKWITLASLPIVH